MTCGEKILKIVLRKFWREGVVGCWGEELDEETS